MVGLGLAVIGGLRRAATRSSTSACSVDLEFSSAALVSLPDRLRLRDRDHRRGGVRRPGALRRATDDQRLVLGALAGATAVGALVSGFAVRRLSLRLVTLVGLAASAVALVAMAALDAGRRPSSAAALSAAVFGLGFGLTVTPRSTAAVEAAGGPRSGSPRRP